MATSSKRIVFILFCSVSLNPFSPVEAADVQGWVDVGDFFNLTENLRVGGDIGYRKSVEGTSYSSFFGRPTVNYSFNRIISVWGGVGLFYQWEPLTSLETRPWVGLVLGYPVIGRVSFANILRLEERLFEFEQRDDRLEIGRLRYRFKAVVPLNRSVVETGTWYLPVYFEVATRVWGDLPTGFVNLGRLSLGLGYRINEDWRLEVTYHQEQRRLGRTTEFRIDEHVVRVQIRGW